MAASQCIIIAVLMIGCLSQRPSYAGSRPIGYPVMEATTAQTTQPNDALRFNNYPPTTTTRTTTKRLPWFARGDRDLFNRIEKLPQEKQPFWFINWNTIEDNMRRPQTYELRTNSYIDPYFYNP